MLHCTYKFCGGCNPRYDRGKAYKQIAEKLAGAAEFSAPREEDQYDVLLIIRGCTACPYLYEEVQAAHRVVCTSQQEAEDAADVIRSFASE
ncbi:MAG: hypothetical protein Q4B15_05210 [Lachnospiraceae bacterium]|nr:hypothetical protein [Lachnospiraceae bacterium]